MVFLSICIPSYNRARFLPDLLKSIVLEYDEGVEIVICDNGSTDETEEVALSWQENYPRIVYERFEKNVGPDRCFLRSVEMAQGTYAWLMGDDDILEPGALQRVLNELKKCPELQGITVNRIAYDFYLQKKWMEKDALKRSEDIFFSNSKTCLESLFTLFGFLSAQIIKRESWLSVAREETNLSSYYNAYVLVYIIGRMIQKNPCWYFIHTPCVGWRSGNDSFAQELGEYRRFALDLNGYVHIAKGLFKEDFSFYRKIMNQICSFHLVAHIRGMKWKGILRKQLKREAFALSFSKLKNLKSFWWPFLPTLLTPTWMLRIFRTLYRSYRKAS